MTGFVARRLLLGLVTLFGASVLVFGLTNILPGDVVRTTLFAGGEGAVDIPEETINKIRHDLGLDKPLVAQYFVWLRKVGTGEMGYSYSDKRSVGSLMKKRIVPTAHIAIQGVILSWLFGLPLGVVSALRRNSTFDYASRLISILGLSLPYFWVGILLTWVLSTTFHYFPPLQYQAPWQNPWVSFQQTWGPSLILAIVQMAYIARMSRSTMLEVLREDYIRTARAKGLRESRVIVRHSLKVALLPVLTLSAVHLGSLLGGTVVVEKVFGIDALGRIVIEAVIRRDLAIVQSVVLMLAFVFVVLNLLVDLLYGWLDPRISRA